jgi:hypothetical protein
MPEEEGCEKGECWVMVLDCAGEHCSEAQPRDAKSESLKCSAGAYEIEGAIPRCCKFHKRSRDRRPHVPERGRKARTWTIEKFRN